jgi:hypothetical protein
MTRFGRTGSFPLLAVLGVLCLVIASELLSWTPTAPPPSPAVAAIGGRSAPGDVSKSPGRRDAWLQQTLERPLFSSARRPSEVGMKGLPRLAGIVLDGSRRVAIFAGPSGGRPVIAQAGSHVGAYEVLAITDIGVTIAGPDGTTLIKPVFDPDRQAASALPTASPIHPPRTVREAD